MIAPGLKELAAAAAEAARRLKDLSADNRRLRQELDKALARAAALEAEAQSARAAKAKFEKLRARLERLAAKLEKAV